MTIKMPGVFSRDLAAARSRHIQGWLVVVLRTAWNQESEQHIAALNDSQIQYDGSHTGLGTNMSKQLPLC